MPDDPEKPPNKRVDELVTEITDEMWKFLKVREMPKVRSNKIITYLIKRIAILETENENLNKEIDKIRSFLVID